MFMDTGTTYEQIARYTCDTGYQESGGDLARMCAEDGNWDGSELICRIYGMFSSLTFNLTVVSELFVNTIKCYIKVDHCLHWNGKGSTIFPKFYYALALVKVGTIYWNHIYIVPACIWPVCLPTMFPSCLHLQNPLPYCHETL